MPGSVFLDRASDYGRSIPEAAAQRYTVLIHMRTLNSIGSSSGGQWDGLGKLFEEQILSAPAIYYCPSHTGEHTFERYARQIGEQSGQIFMNYQYRGKGPYGGMRLFQIESSSALVADALAGEDFFNHDAGFNVLRVDHSVSWYADNGGTLAQRLAASTFGDEDDPLPEIWQLFDGKPDSDD